MYFIITNEAGEELKIKVHKDELVSGLRIKVSDEIFQLFCEEKRRKEREKWEKRNHIDKRDLDSYIVTIQAITETLEETFFRQECMRTIVKIVSGCTPTQRKRFYLYFLGGYTYKKIAEIENCGVSKVQKSVEKVLRKIKNSMKD